jgi:putative ABC transport system permease protein
MRFLAILATALKTLSTHRLRTFLTLLGIIIGVASVVVMQAVGLGAQVVVQQAIEATGSNLFIVLSGAATSGGVRIGGGSAPTLTVADAQALAELPTIAATAPQQVGQAQLVQGAQNWSTRVVGSTQDYFHVQDWRIVVGRGIEIEDVKGAAKVVVIGQTVADELFRGLPAVGRLVRINGSPYTVIGVLAPRGQNLDGRDQDDTAVIPLSTAQTKLFGTPFRGTVRVVMARAKSREVMDRAERAMKKLLRERHRIGKDGENDFTIRNLSAMAEAQAEATESTSALLGTIAVVSLVVGGIGIMNILLVSVTERTREIGVRMAVGARRGDILGQFLAEAVLVSLVGSVLGVLLGVGYGWWMTVAQGLTVVVSGDAILMAMGSALAVGVFFGFYPALKAAWLDPIAALRQI